MKFETTGDVPVRVTLRFDDTDKDDLYLYANGVCIGWLSTEGHWEMSWNTKSEIEQLREMGFAIAEDGKSIRFQR